MLEEEVESSEDESVYSDSDEEEDEDTVTSKFTECSLLNVINTLINKTYFVYFLMEPNICCNLNVFEQPSISEICHLT